MSIEQDVAQLKSAVSSWQFANRAQSYQRALNMRGAQNVHSQLIGAFHPVLGDFGNVSTYELQAPAKAQLGLTIVPDGNVSHGSNVFGLLNQVSGGVYTCGLISQGFNGQPAPNMLLAIFGGNANAIISIFFTASGNYPLMLGTGSQSPTSGTGTMQVNGDTQKLWSVRRTPANSAAAGYLGEVCFDDNFLYVYTSTGWKRTALVAF